MAHLELYGWRYYRAQCPAETSASDSAATESRLDEEELHSVKNPEIRRALKRLYAVRSRKGRK
ncbi:MAG: hypothetical protein HYY83_13800 [Deltaproteobacteria bacterium]|nr:hypothetical protein [Deltaproteobacteria bacterium]